MPVNKTRIRAIPKRYEWGLYLWRKADGHLFKDADNNLLNIPAYRGDIEKMNMLRKVAAHFGQPDGEPYFVPGLSRVTDEKYSEQKDRFSQGLIPDMDDLGAVYDAQQGAKRYGDD